MAARSPFRHHDPAGEPETAQALLLGLELGIPQLAFPLPLLLEGTPPEELLERRIQVPESFLGGTLGDAVHPGDIRLLEGVELAVQVDGGGTLRAGSVPFLLDP